MSSSSSTAPQENYDVFISFRGLDTRNHFTSHLYEALCQKKIQTYIDYKLQRGDEISPSLLKAIQQSKISVVVLSKHYASSSWCLEELIEILRCKKLHDQIVIPVFYDVEPTDVRHQTATFAEAFAEHRKRTFAEAFDDDRQCKESSNKLNRWKAALTETANLSGFTSTKNRPDSELVKEIVEYVLSTLTRLNSMTESYYKGLIGMESKIEKVESLLCIGSGGVCTVGIWGLGGIGKTTIANAMFGKISSHFESSYFVHNVRERLDKGEGLVGMQQELLSSILQTRKENLGSEPLQNTFIRKRLCRTKVFIVFDDVTDSSQIESLVGGLDLFGSESRFIITTRDRQILRSWCELENIYKVEELSGGEALELFNLHAFKKCNPINEFIELSNKVVTKAKGVPLALRVLGSFFLRQKRKRVAKCIEETRKNFSWRYSQSVKNKL